MASIEEINSFLNKAKSLIQAGKWTFIPRSKNMQRLTNLGLTIPLAKKELLSLSFRDYDRGPIDDRDRPGELWEFIKGIGRQEAYIKLKIEMEANCLCLSFHPSSGPKTLPYRKM